MANVSIIVRTKNEERWIGHCLEMIYKQDYKDFEVILVDNNSTDHTVEIAKRHPLASIIMIDKFLPGKALNDGIRASKGKYIICISAHCVPKNTSWISTLLSNFENDPKLAGVYGRQLPTSFTEDCDKRDLLIVFGQDRRVQHKDYFFHNANSMLRRDVWDKFPFDEEVTNIEDRVWGKEITSAGLHIVYDPEAAVFHHHGLHQGNTPKRARGVVSIIEKIDTDVVFELPESWLPQNVNVIAVLPVKGELQKSSKGHELLVQTINTLKESKFVKDIYLLTSQESLGRDLKVKSIMRNEIINAGSIALDELLQKALLNLESKGIFPDSVLYVNYEYVEKPQGLFDELIKDAQYKGYETVFPGFIDFGHFWIKTEDGDYKQTDSSLKTRNEREPVYRALYGQGCLTAATVLRTGKMIGGKVGILPLKDAQCSLRLQDVK